VNEYDPISPDETNATPGTPGDGGSDEGFGAAPEVTAAEQGHGSGARRKLLSRKSTWLVAAVLACVVAGVSIGVAETSGSSSSTTTAAAATATAGQGGPFSGASAGSGSNARSGPEPGGSSGTVTSVSGTTFTLTTPVGEKVTVNESSSTTYLDGSASSTASAITTGSGVLVLGTVNSTTIAATQVTIEPSGSSYTTASSAVTALQQGQQSTAVSIGAIPSNYTEGQGTIVTGTAADQATSAALAVYPGGIVDRVVQLSNGEYEVHYIGTNMHHIFVSSSFQVVGAN